MWAKGTIELFQLTMNFRQQSLVFIVLSPVICLVLTIYMNQTQNIVRTHLKYNLPHNIAQLSDTVWVYSAYLENTNEGDNMTTVTVFIVADEAIKTELSECGIESGTGETVLGVVTISKIEDRYRLQYDLWRVFCTCDTVIRHPVQVTLYTSITNHTVPLYQGQYAGMVGCCLAGPLWREGAGDKGVMDIISWVEYQRMMGVEKILVYAMKQGKNTQAVLDYYVSEGVIDVTHWDFPISNKNFRYYGQNLLINDCLYRSRYLFNYTLFIDLDEIVVPALHDNLTDLLDNITDDKVSAYGLTNRFHHTHWRVPHTSLKALYPSLSRIPFIPQALLTHKVR